MTALTIGDTLTEYYMPIGVVDINDSTITKQNYTVCSEGHRSDCLLIQKTVRVERLRKVNKDPAKFGRLLCLYRDTCSTKQWIRVHVNHKKMMVSILIPDKVADHAKIVREAMSQQDKTLSTVTANCLNVSVGDLVKRSKGDPTEYLVIHIGAQGARKLWQQDKPVLVLETLARLVYKREGKWSISQLILLGKKRYKRVGFLTVEQMLCHDYDRVRQTALEIQKRSENESSHS